MARRMLHSIIDYSGQRFMQTSDLRDLAKWVAPGLTITVAIHSRVIHEPEPLDKQPLHVQLDWPEDTP